MADFLPGFVPINTRLVAILAVCICAKNITPPLFFWPYKQIMKLMSLVLRIYHIDFNQIHMQMNGQPKLNNLRKE